MYLDKQSDETKGLQRGSSDGGVCNARPNYPVSKYSKEKKVTI
jgi:hypothetical protein